MKRSISSLLIAAVLPLGAAAVVLSTSSDASAQRYYHAPPSEYVARYRPVYYHGYAHYYYNGHWGYYRPGQGWYYYDHAPAEICHYSYDYYGDRSVNCN